MTRRSGISRCNLQVLDSSPPSAAYMHQWIESGLVQIMARRLFGVKPLSKPMLGYCQLDPSHFSEILVKNRTFFIQENVFESLVCETATILFRGRWVNSIPALVQIMAWCRPCDKPLSEPKMVSWPTHICVTRPQWVDISYSVKVFYLDTNFTRVCSCWSKCAWVNIASSNGLGSSDNKPINLNSMIQIVINDFA